MNVKAGDEMYLSTWVYINFAQMRSWEKIVITRTTKTLIFVGNLKFRKSSIRIDLFEINDETIRKATEDNNLLEHKKLQVRFSNYKWGNIDLATLMNINEILILAENQKIINSLNIRGTINELPRT